MVLAFAKIASYEENGEKGYVLIDDDGKMLELQTRGNSIVNLDLLEGLAKEFLEKQTMFVQLYYDEEKRRIVADPYSIITEKDELRTFI